MEWTGALVADCPSVEVDVLVDAPPAVVWDIVSDPAAIPDLSDELQGVRWSEGADTGGAGARFEGTNVNEHMGEWTTTSTVVGYEPLWRFAWAVGDPEAPIATWAFTLRPEGAATRLTQSVRLGPGRSGITFAIEAMPDKEDRIVFVRMRRHEAAMTATVEGIKARAEALHRGD